MPRENVCLARAPRATFVLSILVPQVYPHLGKSPKWTAADTLELYHHIPGRGSPFHKCETMHSCKSKHHCLPRPHYMTKLPQQVNQNWPGCLVKGGGGQKQARGGGMVKKKMPGALPLPPRTLVPHDLCKLSACLRAEAWPYCEGGPGAGTDRWDGAWASGPDLGKAGNLSSSKVQSPGAWVPKLRPPVKCGRAETLGIPWGCNQVRLQCLH